MKIITTQSLDLTGNQLALLPGDLFNQVDLEELWIDDNQISEIPFEKETNANINACDIDGRTALMWAVIRGHEEIAKCLLEHGVNIKLTDSLGNTALDWSKIMHRTTIQQKLSNYTGNI